MVEHLQACGHSRIAFIAGPQNNFDAHERLRGYRDALFAADPAAEPIVLPGDFSEASGHLAGQQLLASGARPQAVFAANDMMALGCLYALNQAGLRVPQDIALAGFDDIPLARYVMPSLTTMQVNIAELGAHAMRVLLEVYAGDDVPAALAPLVPELIVRESSGASAKAGGTRPQ